MDIGCPSIIAPSCVRTHPIPSLTRSLPPRTTASPLHSHLAPPLPSLHPPPPPLVRRHQQPAAAASNPATTMDHNAPGQSHPPGFFPVQHQVVDLTASSSSMPPRPVNFVGYPGAQAFGPQYLAGAVGAADLQANGEVFPHLPVYQHVLQSSGFPGGMAYPQLRMPPPFVGGHFVPPSVQQGDGPSGHMGAGQVGGRRGRRGRGGARRSRATVRTEDSNSVTGNDDEEVSLFLLYNVDHA